MFHIALFRIRAFAAGNLASFLASLGRGGLMFMLIIWLQGIWLPQHGYSFAETPLWAGIYMLPMTAGFLIAGPLVGLSSPTATARGPSPPAAWLVAALIFAARAAPGQLQLRVVRACCCLLNGAGHGPVRLAQPGRDHEHACRPTSAGAGAGMAPPSRTRPWCSRSASSSPSIIVGPRVQPARRAVPRAGRPGGARQRRRPGRRPAAGGQPVRRVPRLQPHGRPCSVRSSRP